MHTITLLSSCHGNFGLCNPLELYKIIENIKPDVIFEELDLETFDYVYKQSYPSANESIAISRYLQTNRTKHFPVDTFDFDDFPMDDKAIMDNTFGENQDFKKLVYMQYKLMEEKGYLFLNSKICSEIVYEIQRMENLLQQQLNNEKISSTYKAWVELCNNRERTMIENIYKYCKANLFNTGLLITGAEHRNSLINIMQNYKDDEINIYWNVINYEINL